MAGTNRVAVQLLYEVNVVYGNLLGKGSARISPEGVTGDALEEDTIPVDVETLSGPDFNRAESELLMDRMASISLKYRSS